jgi:tripartite-type tricarboxylate transporter receptor subunit TctC
MGPLLGQQIAVENKPGGGSSIAADYVAHAAKDGYTLFLATLSIIVNQIINPNPAFDMKRDLAPIALLSQGAVVLVVNQAGSRAQLRCSPAGHGSVSLHVRAVKSNLTFVVRNLG